MSPPTGITDGPSCLAKCVQTPGCDAASFGQELYFYHGCMLKRATGPLQGFSSHCDTYVILPPGPCPEGTKSDGTSCNACLVPNCAECAGIFETTCVTCNAGYTLVDSQCNFADGESASAWGGRLPTVRAPLRGWAVYRCLHARTHRHRTNFSSPLSLQRPRVPRQHQHHGVPNRPSDPSHFCHLRPR